MDIKSLPSGTRCLVDANIFIYHFGGASGESTDFLARVAKREVEAHVTTTIIAEVLHRRMTAEAITKGLISPGKPLQKLKTNPNVIQGLTDYISEVEKLLKLPIVLHDITAAEVAASHALRSAHGLFVNDSINLACALHLGLADVVTHDDDFNRVTTITTWEPTDI
ncbi:MAG TPA: PIN domain-containing protein [Pyrinomonadaceae bacterium]|nr:PIN domain-containing protein [Pyrinomonadaceae bacterium]